MYKFLKVTKRVSERVHKKLNGFHFIKNMEQEKPNDRLKRAIKNEMKALEPDATLVYLYISVPGFDLKQTSNLIKTDHFARRIMIIESLPHYFEISYQI